MKINSVETISMNKLTIEDSAKKPVSLKIEAAHAGIVNGNYIFYTPKALREGSKSLKEFFKPLQKKHFDKTLGYIYDAVFEERQTSSYQSAIETASTPEELGKAVKAYYYSEEYHQGNEWQINQPDQAPEIQGNHPGGDGQEAQRLSSQLFPMGER